MNRRGFLQGILIAAAAPAIVRADSLMRIVPRELSVVAPEEFTSCELALSIDQFAEGVLKPAVLELARCMDSDILLRIGGRQPRSNHPFPGFGAMHERKVREMLERAA